jgi:hypothetical protein
MALYMIKSTFIFVDVRFEPYLGYWLIKFFVFMIFNSRKFRNREGAKEAMNVSFQTLICSELVIILPYVMYK